MSKSITLLTDEQAREIAEQAAIRALQLYNSSIEFEQKEDDFPEIMTIKELADYLKCSPITIYRKVKNNRFPVVRQLGRPRFLRSEVDKWLKKRL